ncbi:quinone oxidoreductase family protein [Actinoplanes friuliensis]|uniref:Putative alcohol dehydrogenase n=1 Tax=Actinoplanes friuliensis DSM 7358 TaxID=1246995 RepID=U5VTP4_9ACTN|nr:zinc-binding alcohol dehydrogenase family protein [Actinoplanes friuliensis]AGZ39060.1 putative alcohol dehydrogenase [Actinoplanes friuliensis DSM 7358]
MRAALLHACGAPPALGDRAAPVPGDDEILVRVTAASITPLDLLCASGTSYFGEPDTPYVPGVQGVGVREDGTAVWFPTSAGMRPGDGSLAEFAAVRAADTVELPEGADHRLVAALGLSAVAAHLALTWRGELQPGEQVLVLGAGGVVGQAAVQLALLAGARRVVAVARSERAQQRAARAGAAVVVPLEEGAEIAHLAARMRAAADGPVDLVLDPLFGVPAAAALRALRPGGRLVNLGSAAGEIAPLDSATLRSGSLRILGYTNNELTPQLRADTLTLIASHAAAGRLTVDFETVRLHDITTAWHRTDCRIVVVP